MDLKVIHCPDRVTSANAGELKQQIREVCKAGPCVLQLDMEGVEYMDSGGLGVLVYAFEQTRTQGGALQIHRPSPPVRDLLTRSRFDYVLDLVDHPPGDREGGSCILVVDDDPHIAMLMTRYLEAANFSVVVAKDGREAVRLAREEHPKLIVMDLLMPVMDGESAARELKSDPKTAGIPIVALTAKYGGPAERKYFEACISKPFKLSDFTSIIPGLG